MLSSSAKVCSESDGRHSWYRYSYRWTCSVLTLQWLQVCQWVHNSPHYSYDNCLLNYFWWWWLVDFHVSISLLLTLIRWLANVAKSCSVKSSSDAYRAVLIRRFLLHVMYLYLNIDCFRWVLCNEFLRLLLWSCRHCQKGLLHCIENITLLQFLKENFSPACPCWPLWTNLQA